jgi:large subunit ribosomal protein L20
MGQANIGGKIKMARVKKGLNAKKRHKKILKLAKGFYGAKSKIFRAANPAVMRSLRSAYVGRKNKKREYRRLWIARINAGARMNGLSYSKLMNGLKVSGIEINRKMLAEMAIYDPAGFTQLAETAKKAVK